ncbi:hypothetical protein H6771_02005 [Candidatus Peribacteria bacterium]|nr:hypothetical protein [Candidatus Peribacteria bacterium]
MPQEFIPPDAAVPLPEPLSDPKPEQSSLALIFIRAAIGLGSGVLGAIILALVLLLSWNVVGDTLTPQDAITNEFGVQQVLQPQNPLFLWFVLLAVFFGTLVANITHTLLVTVTEAISFNRGTVLTHVFFGHLVLLFPVLVLYLSASSGFSSDGVTMAALGHMTLMVVFTYWVQQTFRKDTSALVHLYGMVLGLIMAALLCMLLFSAGRTVLIFGMMPLLMGALYASNGAVHALYHWLTSLYGTEFLSSESTLGADTFTDANPAEHETL